MKEKTVENLEKYVVKDVSGAAPILQSEAAPILQSEAVVVVTHIVEKCINEMILMIQFLMCL